MTNFDVTAAIDVIVADLQAQRTALGLPVFTVQKYVAPTWVSAEMSAALLAVYVAEVDPILEDTSGEYDYRNRICICWAQAVPDSLTTGQVDNGVAAGIIRNVQSIYRYVGKTYYPGLPGYAPQSEVTIRGVRYGKPMGGVFGGEIDIWVADWL